MKPKIIAHRGASAHRPENTLAAFQLALDQGADGIELDVMLSADGEMVVIHDEEVDRTTNGHGKVRNLTLNQLKALDAGQGESIPTLAEVLDRFGGKFLINIELKNYASILDALPVKVAHLVASRHMAASVLISSFNPINLPRFRQHCAGAKVGLLILPGKIKHWLWRMFRVDALHPHYQDVDALLVSAVQGRGREVNVWTVDDPDQICRLTNLGVDSIITNDPLRTREIMESCR